MKVTEYERLLVYEPGYSPAFVRDTLEREQLNGLAVQALLPGEVPNDLAFLRDFSFLTHLAINAIPVEDFDYGVLSELGNLLYFTLNVPLSKPAKPRPLDLGHLARLRSLALTWRDGVTGFDQLTELERLRLIEFRGEDLRLIASEKKLIELVLKTSSIRSVSGIEAHRGLETVLFGACSRLRELEALSTLHRLQKLTLTSCRRLTQIDALSALHRLTELEMTDCPRLESIRPISGLRLERLSIGGTTDIADGDILPAAGARELFYRPRAHYNARLPTPQQDALVEQNRRKILGLA